MARWWTQLHDPLPVELIDAAQAVEAWASQLQSRIAQARATQVGNQAALLPALDAQASASRGFNDQLARVATTSQAGLQASWELDPFGANRAAKTAADERLAGAQASWHEARVSVAAEVAQQTSTASAPAWPSSRWPSATHSPVAKLRLSQLSERAGFTAPATAALGPCQRRRGQARASQQRMQCDVGPRPWWRSPAGKNPRCAPGWPSRWLRPRTLVYRGRTARPGAGPAPDVYNAEREVAAASADVASAQAQRYPRLTSAAAWAQPRCARGREHRPEHLDHRPAGAQRAPL
ncbi:MAG: TolC family protein [Paenacidovorax caeni]